MRMRSLHKAGIAGLTLVEVMISMVAAMTIMAALVSGSAALQRSFQTTTDYAAQESDQLRLWDYLALDLRRAQTTSLTTDGAGNSILTITIPDYYQSNDSTQNTYWMRRIPTIAGGVVTYGTTPVTITYQKVGNAIRRSEAGVWTTIVSGVEDFHLTLNQVQSVITHTESFTPESHPLRPAKAVTVGGTVEVRNAGV